MNVPAPALVARRLPLPDAPTLAILAAVLLWGGSYAATKISVSVLPVWTVMWLRLTLALALLLPAAKTLCRARVRPGDWKALLALMAIQPCLYFLCEANALKYTTSAQAGVIVSSLPLLVALGARVFLGEALSRRSVAGMLTAMAGVSWLTLAAGPSEQAPAPLLGNLLELGAMCCAAGYMLLLKGLSSRYNPWTLTALQTLAGVLFFSPGAMPLLRGEIPLPGPEVVGALVFLGAGASLGAFGLYNWGMSRIRAGQAASYINGVPVVAVFLGWGLLGEALNPAQLAASVLVGVGIWVSRR
jgi:drug/metabolite transporter (DMT)-like permease